MFLLAALMAQPAVADTPVRQAKNFGIGVGAGLPLNGLSMKYFTSKRAAVQGVVGWWGLGRDASGLGVDLDVLLEMPELANGDAIQLAWNVGLGGAVVVTDNSLRAGPNGVVGLEFNLNPVPIDIVLEYKPHIVLVPNFDVDLVNFGGHIRIYL